ncbi:Bardet-Biedl syndrome 10 protein homolog [Hyalella azteca]|uniref:Bardet-Biedl syndrome 10 protein homolog n=1 Tax=Hyalella azteca TaxID=294128 RepID=A0A979FU59_HYAAZ|nr:Bardet-Biedl syndrome 10 protein homolog [Hyalella azteca]
MTQPNRVATCRLDRLCLSSNVLTAVVAASFGRRGSAVLMENSGKVIITRDGCEILSSLRLEDSVLSFAVSGILQFAKQRGDGSKTGLVLLNNAINVTNDIFFSTGMREMSAETSFARCSTLKVVRRLRQHLLPRLSQLAVRRYCSIISPKDENWSRIIDASLISFLETRFPKYLAGKLAAILSEFLQVNSKCHSLQEIVLFALNNIQNIIFQVYKCPFRMSRVTKGFIISRDFKIELKKSDNCVRKVLFWSLPLEQSTDSFSSFLTIDTSDKNTFMRSIFHSSFGMQKLMEEFQNQKIELIVSSLHFPDWAVAACKQHEIALVDFVSDEEFSFLVQHLKVSPLVCKTEIFDHASQCEVEVNAIYLGSSRFVHFTCHSSQMIISGPTVTQCNQFSKALTACLKMLRNWLEDSKNFLLEQKIINNDESLADFPIKDNCIENDLRGTLVWSPSDGFIQCAMLLVIEKYPCLMKLGPEERKLLISMLAEVPQILNGMLVAKTRFSLLKHLHETFKEIEQDHDNGRLKERAIAECRIENPLNFIEIAHNAMLRLESILRIESVVHVKHRSTKVN